MSISILNLNSPGLIIPLLQQLLDAEAAFAARGLGFQVIIGDTGSVDPDVLKAYCGVPDFITVLPDLTYHFSRSNNDCLQLASHDHFLLLNNDVILRSPEPLLAMYDVLTGDRDLGIVGLALDFPGGTVQHAGIDVLRSGAWRGFPFHPGAHSPAVHRPGASYEVIATTGACMMLSADLWNAAGGLDEDYEKECQDVELCLTVQRLGYRVRVVDAGPVVHLENATRMVGEEHWPDRNLMTRRWMSFIEASFL